MTLRRRNGLAIRKMFQRFSKESRDLIDSAVALAWYMRGSLQYHDAYDLTPYERERLNDFITNRIEAQKDAPYKVY